MVKITTKQQFKLLVQQMEANPIIARGGRPCGEIKAATEEVWRSITKNLNSCGPPMRTSEEWQRVWIHFKANLKRKISNKRNSTTPGESPQGVTLSPLEQAVANLMQREITVNSADNVFGAFEVFDIHESLESEPNIIIEQSEIDIPQTSRERNRPEDQRTNLLKNDNDTDMDLLNTLKNIEEHMYKKNEILKEVVEIKRKKYEVLKDIRDIKKKKFEKFLEEQTLNRKIKEKKLEVLRKQLYNLENAADDPPASIYTKSESLSLDDICGENVVMENDSKASKDMIGKVTVDKSGWYIIDEFIPDQK